MFNEAVNFGQGEAGSSGANGPEMEKTGVKEATCALKD